MAAGGRLAGRVALVTGGGRGIGRAIALELAREGARIAVSSRTRQQLDAVVAEVKELGSEGISLPADVMRADETKAAVARTIEHFGQLDVLVNNAGGIAPAASLEGLLSFTHDDQAFADNLVLNLFSTYWATREALPHMRERGYGRILNIGSGYAKTSGGLISYTAAKHGVVGLTRALAAETAAYGITVNCLCPGWTRTQLVDWNVLGALAGVSPEEARRAAEADNLQGRVLEPEELGPMAALLASEGAGGITGQVISVDGGYKV